MSNLRAALLRPEWSLDLPTVERLERFYGLLRAEGEVQNLTRLETPEEFVDGHVWDCFELLRSGLVGWPALDLGSGAGVPGLLCAILRPDRWILAESERRKADFLHRAVEGLGLPHVSVQARRAEEVLETENVESVVARAVGPVDRIYGWIGARSTWNTLVLLKSRKWEDEWAKASQTKAGRKLVIENRHEYSVGPEKKYRLIVRLGRTDRRR